LIIEAVLDLGDDFLDALGDPRPGDDGQDQLVLRVAGDMVPPIALVVIGSGRRASTSFLIRAYDPSPVG
jgi:hypothetical protein